MRTLLVSMVVSLALLIGCKGKPSTVYSPKPVAVNPALEEPEPLPYVGKIEERQVQTPDWVSSVAVATPIMMLNAPRLDVDLSQAVVEKVEAALISTGRFQVAERSRLESVKKEIVTNNDADWFNPANATKVGRFMGAKFLVLPSVSAHVGPMTTTFELQIKILETETGTLVHNYVIRTASSSLSVNASIRTCVSSLQFKLEDEIKRDFPPRGVVVKVINQKTLWVDARQAALIRPGMSLRVLVLEEVYNPVARTKGTFSSFVGEAMVLTVENNGLTAKLKSRKTEILPGMVVEVKP